MSMSLTVHYKNINIQTVQCMSLLFIITILIFKLSSPCHWTLHYKNINIQTVQCMSINCSLHKYIYSNSPVHVTKLFIITISIFKLSSPRHWTVHYKKHQYSNSPVHVNKLFIKTISIFKLSSACHWTVHYRNINIQTLQCMSLNW